MMLFDVMTCSGFLVLDPGNALQSVTFSTNVNTRPTAGNTFSFLIDSSDPAATKILTSCSRCSGYIIDLNFLGQNTLAQCDTCSQRLLPVLEEGLASGNITLNIQGQWSVATYIFNYVSKVALHVQGSPMTLQVTANLVSPANCIASGGGLVGTSLRNEAKVIITARDAWGNERLNLDVPPDSIMMNLAGKSH